MTPESRHRRQLERVERDAALETYRARVAVARAELHLSHAKHARLADTDPGTLNKFLHGADIRISTFVRICEAAGLEVTLTPKLRKTA